MGCPKSYGKQNYQCKDCRRQFIGDHALTYHGCHSKIEDIILNDEKRQIYKRIIIQKDKVIGAVLFGDTEDGTWYAEQISDQTPISNIRNKLLFGKDFALKRAG